MYQYVATRNRVHRVYVDDGNPSPLIACNLDGKLGGLQADTPAGPRCSHCWGVDPVSSMLPARGFMAAAVTGALLAGTAFGVVASPDTAPPPAPTFDTVSLVQLVDRVVQSAFDERLQLTPEPTPTPEPIPTPEPAATLPVPSPIVIYVPRTRVINRTVNRITNIHRHSKATPAPTATPTPEPTAEPTPSSEPTPEPTW
jgi:hypothetical protein